MKKLLYVLALVVLTSLSFTGCTDENIQPTSQEGGSAGGGDDKKN